MISSRPLLQPCSQFALMTSIELHRVKRLRLRQAEPSPLRSEAFLHLADFLLDLPPDLFDLALGFYVGIVCCCSSNLLFDFTFHLVKRSFCFVLSALLHGLGAGTCQQERDTWFRSLGSSLLCPNVDGQGCALA